MQIPRMRRSDLASANAVGAWLIKALKAKNVKYYTKSSKIPEGILYRAISLVKYDTDDMKKDIVVDGCMTPNPYGVSNSAAKTTCSFKLSKEKVLTLTSLLKLGLEISAFTPKDLPFGVRPKKSLRATPNAQPCSCRKNMRNKVVQGCIVPAKHEATLVGIEISLIKAFDLMDSSSKFKSAVRHELNRGVSFETAVKRALVSMIS